MTVWVDNAFEILDVPKKWEGGGHLVGSNLLELHGFAARLGLKRSWFQGDSTFAHYDLTKGKRMQAIRLGAVEIDPEELPDTILQKNAAGDYEQRGEIQRKRQAVQ